MSKYFIVAGERSGDLHASNLMRELAILDPSAEFYFYGGDYMKEVGGTLLKHYSDMNYMGVTDVLFNLNKIFKNLKECKHHIQQLAPDVVILVDFSGFNLRLASYTHSQGILTYYYISPKIWAWYQSRAYNIKKWIHRMFVILPFEKDFYAKYGFHKVDYVGNPILDAIRRFRPNPDFLIQHELQGKEIIALLPGSRATEIKTMLQYLPFWADKFSSYTLVIAAVSNQPLDLYQSVLPLANCKLVIDQTYDLLIHAKAAIVTSGTATLETALFHVPQVVCYKVNAFTYLLKPLVQVKYIALANLIADQEIVKELLQSEFTPENVRDEIHALLHDEAHRNQAMANYQFLSDIMGDNNASQTTAKLIQSYLKEDLKTINAQKL